MTQDEAIKRTSEFLQKIFHDEKDSLEQLRKMEEKKDVGFFIAALEQLRLSCVGLKQIITNQITKEQIAKITNYHYFYDKGTGR